MSPTLSAHPGPEFPEPRAWALTSLIGASCHSYPDNMDRCATGSGLTDTSTRTGPRGSTSSHLRSEDDGTTTLTGLVQDQSQLHGLLAKIRDLGLTLISMRVLDESQMDATTEEEDW